MIVTLPIPHGIEIVETSTGIRFLGSGELLLDLYDEFREVVFAARGMTFSLPLGWILVVDEPSEVIPKSVIMPVGNWLFFQEAIESVASAADNEPFDQTYPGWDPPRTNSIGVERVGPPFVYAKVIY
jgi:hypothetical protein